MQLSYSKQFAAMMAIVSSHQFATADNNLLGVVPDDACVDLVTGSDMIVLGQVCTEVTGDNVVVTFNMTGVEADCCIKETHICNMPPMIANIDEDGCLKTKVVPFSVMDVFGFMCAEPCDTFQFNGHATVICDAPLRDDPTKDSGDPLPDGVGQGNYGEREYCYGAMYDVGLECGPCTELCPAFDCTDDMATNCGLFPSSGSFIACYCSRDTSNIAPNPEVEDFCWQDIGCFVPTFYLTSNPGSPCSSNADCLGSNFCVPSTCCGLNVCLPPCNPDLKPGDKGTIILGDIEVDAALMDCTAEGDDCTMPSGEGDLFKYPPPTFQGF